MWTISKRNRLYVLFLVTALFVTTTQRDARAAMDWGQTWFIFWEEPGNCDGTGYAMLDMCVNFCSPGYWEYNCYPSWGGTHIHGNCNCH
jgi:hypothetical protein